MKDDTHEPPAEPLLLDTAQVKRSFECAAGGYDEVAVLQAEVRGRLLARLELVKLAPELVLDPGAGTGHASRALARRYRRAQVLAIDIAEAMLRQARGRQSWLRKFSLACADAARLPLRDATVDLIFSNLLLHWCNDLNAVFAEFRRVLKPHGLLTFSTFGPDTLSELRQAWSEADGYSHVNRFYDMHDIGDALVQAGLAEPVMDVERFTLTYDRVEDLMRDLKALGEHNVTLGRARGLTGRGRLDAMRRAYERFRTAGRLPATYEVVYGQAWGATPGRGVAIEGGEARVPVSRVGRRER